MKSVLALAFVLSALVASPALADETRPTPVEGRRPAPPHPREVIREHAAELDLDEATLAAIDKVFGDHEDLRDMHDAVHRARAEHGKDSPELADAVRALKAREQSLFKSLRRLLTDAQWTAVRVLMKPPAPPGPARQGGRKSSVS